MRKEEFFKLQAPYVYEDGTYDELLEVLEKHPQDNSEVIIKASKEISEFINFNMGVSESFWSKSREDYFQFFDEDEDVDYDKYELSIWSTDEQIYPDTDLSTITYPNIKKILRMLEVNKRKKDKERREKYRVPYGYVFSLLLEGHDFTKEED